MSTPVLPAPSYVDHLPAVFHGNDFLRAFLAGFEDVLGAGPGGLERRIGELVAYLDPATYAGTPDRPAAPPPNDELLPWLASWVALTLRADWSPRTKADFIQKIVPLYRKRGTLAGLREMLGIYIATQDGGPGTGSVVVHDRFDNIPHYFQVELTLRDAWSAQAIIQAIIDREKPAHTFYHLKINRTGPDEPSDVADAPERTPEPQPEPESQPQPQPEPEPSDDADEDSGGLFTIGDPIADS